MARPRKDDADKRGKSASARVPPDVHAAYWQATRDAGFKCISDWIRSVLDRELARLAKRKK